MAHVAVVDPSGLFRAGLVSLLSTLGFDGVADAANVEELEQHVNGDPRPDVLLINLARGVKTATEAMQEVRESLPGASVVFLAADLNLDRLSECFAAGASGYLLENISRDALLESLRLVSTGAKVFPSELASLIRGLIPTKGRAAIQAVGLDGYHLSDREIDILRCLAAGQPNKVIAHTLNIAEATVKVHVKRILRKTNATNRTQAALWAAARGLATIALTVDTLT